MIARIGSIALLTILVSKHCKQGRWSHEFNKNPTASSQASDSRARHTKGETWTFTNPEPLVFVRAKVVVKGIEGDRVLLSDGPAAGTAVVTVGATELMGAEHKYGH